MPASDPILDAALQLAGAGIAVHWLKHKSKKPIDDGWPTAAVATPETLSKTYRTGYNLGIRPGVYSNVGGVFLHILDIDIRDPAKSDEAYAWLDEHWPDWRSFPIVQSGSGGASRHVYFFTTAAHRSHMVARSNEHTTYQDRKVWCWQIEVYGSRKQVAAPPSIHPDTDLPYKWLTPLDFDALDLCAPMVSEALLESWTPTSDTPRAEPNENRLGLTPDDARAILAKLPLEDWCEDRNGWCKVGMALQHEFGEEGYDLWTEFSEQSDKFDPEDQQRVWRSFRSSETSNPVRMATLKAASRAVEIAEMFEDMGGEEVTYTPPQSHHSRDAAEKVGDANDLHNETEENADILGIFDAPQSARNITAALPPPAVEWTSKLDLSDEGAIRPTLPNVALIIRNDPRTRGLMCLNLFTQEIVQRTTPGTFKMKKDSPKGTKQLAGAVWRVKDTVNGDLWSESKDNAVRDILESPSRQGGYALRVSDRDLKAAIDIVGNENSFHPVQEYLENLVWDATPRLESVFVRYLGADDNAYTRSIAWLVFIAAVTRVYEPGHKFDFALILEGMQGKRKSTFISILGRRWSSELEGDFSNTQQMVEKMQGSWILEIPELSGFNKYDVRMLKAFISRTTDKVRLSYARRAQEFPRQGILIGSTNDREYLRDDTGGRRFWPLECKVDEIDTEAFAAEVDQLWAEALAGYRRLRAARPTGQLPLYLTDEKARATAVEIQETRRIESPDDMLAGQISAWLDKPIVDETGFDDLDELLGGVPGQRNETCLIQIWVECLGKDVASYIGSSMPSQSLGRAMKRIPEWTNIGTRSTKYGRQRVYRRFGFEPADL